MSFKKIAICLPSYNEESNISNITKIVDEALVNYNKNNTYKTYIINADSASTDNTVNNYLHTNTYTEKISIVNNRKGKGINLISFFKYCYDNKIDFALTLDSDLISVTPKWIYNILDKLIIEEYDYVVPIYKRSRYEGSTTNQFAYPLVYAATGYKIRQPIAGDFGFSKKFIKEIVKQKYNLSTTKYGIDIYMTLTACIKKLKIGEVVLDKKIHAPSFNKMEDMFIDVLDSTLNVLKNNKYEFIEQNQKMIESNILTSRKFKHKDNALEILNRYKLSNTEIDSEWIKIMNNIVSNPSSINENDYEYIRKVFINKAIKFWFKSQYISSKKCEEIINKQCIMIRERISTNGNKN